jgi:cytochrome c-type biogenesis protein CcmH/NrfG
VAAALEELLHLTAVRALEQQERQVSELRARTGTLLAAAALSASFLGATAVDRSGLSVLVVLAIVALAGVVALSLYVLVPHTMVFAVDVRELHKALYPDADDDRLVHARLAYELHDIRADNQPRVDRLFRCFRWAAIVLGVEIAVWIAALAVS